MTVERSATAEAAKTSIDRLMYFSDAVLAIALTLLALDLPVPDSQTREALFTALRGDVSAYLAFLVSFLVIAQQWRAHHRLFRYVVDAPGALVSVNTVWLLTVILTPFVTRLLWAGSGTDGGDFPYRFGLYAVVQALASVTFYRSAVVIGRDGLLAAGTPDTLLPESRSRSLVLAATFLLSAGLVFVVGSWAFVTWALMPLVLRLVHRTRRPAGGPAAPAAPASRTDGP